MVQRACESAGTVTPQNTCVTYAPHLILKRQVLALSVLGVVLVAISVILGGLSTGYGKGGIPILLRVGVGYVVLGMATALWSPLTIQRGIMNAIVSAIAIFVVGVSIMYFDLGIRPPEYGTPLTLRLLISTQTQLLMIILPVPAGYVAGVLVSLEKYPHAVFVFVIVSLAGALAGTKISLIEGSAPGFTEMLFLLSTLFVMAFGMFSIVVMGWWGSERPTDT